MISLLVVVVLSTFTTIVSAQDVVYNFNAACTNTGCADNCHGLGSASWSSLNTTIIAAASDFTLGPGLGSSSFVCGGLPMNGFAAGFSANPSRARWADNWTALALANMSDFFTFTLTPAPFTNVQLALISWQMQRSSSGPTMYEVRMSTDDFVTFSTFAVASETGTGWVTRMINTGLPSFNNDPIEIRIYGYSSSSTGGSLRIDNVRVYTTVTNLPIELVSFTASAESGGVKLDWVTASERNNEYFTVLRSSDPNLVDSWEEVGRVGSLGDSQSSTFYSAFDPNPLNGVSYYKLRQTDLDGTFTESSVVPVSFIRSITLSVGGNALIEGQDSYLIDGLGRIIAFERVHTLRQPGTYFLQGENGQVVRLHVLP